MVLYVRGIVYDFSTKQFVHTGLLAVRSDPKNISIFLDGKKVRSGDGDIKFLYPKEYEVRLTAPGYFDWVKHLRINANQVTWVSNNNNKKFLFLKNAPAVTLDSQVLDYTLSGSSIYTVTSNTLTEIAQSSGKKSVWTVAGQISSIKASDDGSVLLLSGNGTTPQAFLFSTSAKTILSLSPLFASGTTFSLLGNALYAQSGTSVYQVDKQTGAKVLLAQNVKTFTATPSFLYYTTNLSKASWLYAKSLSSGTETALLQLPEFSQERILVTPLRQVFLLADNALYRVNTTLDKISDNVTGIELNQTTGNFAAAQGGELDRYDFNSQNWQFITRSSLTISNLAQRDDLGYIFVKKGSAIAALELDTRDHPNEFTFYESASISKFTVDSDAKILYILDGNNLVSLNIRS